MYLDEAVEIAEERDTWKHLADERLKALEAMKKENAPSERDVRLESLLRANFSKEDLAPRFREGNESIAEALKVAPFRNPEVRGRIEDIIEGEGHVGEFLLSEECENREGSELT